MAVPGELGELGNESGYLKSMVQFYKTKKSGRRVWRLHKNTNVLNITQ